MLLCFTQYALAADDAAPSITVGEGVLQPFTATTRCNFDDTPLELRPYRVHLVVADSRAEKSDRDDLQAELGRTVDRTWGGRWCLALESRFPSPWSDERSFRRFRPDSISNPGDVDAVDVRYFVQIFARPIGVQVHVRAWEPIWNHASPVLSATVYDSREAPLKILELCRELFRPRAHWVKTDDYSARLIVQGAAIAAPDPEFPIVQPHEIFTPWLIARNREGAITRQQAVPWTYFIAENTTDGQGAVRVISGLRAPLSAKPRGRIEFLAVAARAQWPGTRLDCVTQSRPSRALAAHRVEVTPIDITRPPTEEETSPVPDFELTDRLGAVRLEAADEPRMIWAAMFSGTLKLARVPVVPGSIDALRIDLPDDAIRLQAEGQLQLLTSELVDAVAQRSVVFSAARAAAKKADWATVKLRMTEAQKISNPQPLLERVSAVRVPAVSAALQKKDRTTEQRVQRMCDEAAEMIRHYLDDERLKLLQEEMDELQRIDQLTKDDVRAIDAKAKPAPPTEPAARPATDLPAAPPQPPAPKPTGF